MSRRKGIHRPGQSAAVAEQHSMFSSQVDGQDAIEMTFQTGSDIEGNVDGPAQFVSGQRHSRTFGNVETPLSNVYDPDQPDGHVGRAIRDFLKYAVFNVKLKNPEDSYMNNFIVNLHNHNIPLPLPLQYFITDFDISSSQSAPYQSCNFTLKMPPSLAMGIFTGPNAHPEPGQWLCIRHLPNDNDDEFFDIDLNREWAQGLSDQMGEGMQDLQFLGTITSLNWSITTDQNTGEILATIDVQANSFVHNLMFAEYRIKNVAMADQTESEVFTTQLDEGSPATGDNIIGGALTDRDPNDTLSENYFLPWPAWRRLLGELASGAVGKVNLKQSMEKLLRGLGYPLLPASFDREPTDFVHMIVDFFNTFEQVDIVTNMKKLYETFGPEIGTLLIHGAINVMEMLQIESPIVNSTSIQGTAARIYGEMVDDDGNLMFPPKTPDDADSITEVNRLREFLGDPQLLPSEPINIGRLIHIATTRDDIPPSHPLWGTMPHKDEPFIDLNRIKNYGMKTTTVWDLVTGTFQPDNQIIELFPVILNASNRDVTDYYKTKGIKINPIYQKLGGIPTIILRLKPVHPMIGREGISSTNINRQKLYNKVRGASHYSYTQDLAYKPASETVTDPVTGRVMADFKDNSYGQVLPYTRNDTMSSTHPDYKHTKALPVFVFPHEIKNLRFTQSDRARVNSVKVSSPEMANMTSRLRFASEGDMVHNTEMALRHGWRSYNPSWPYAEYRGSPTTRPSAETAVAAGQIYTALSERMYMIYGDDQMYFSGQLSCSSQISKSITPGVWLEIPFSMIAAHVPFGGYAGQAMNMLIYVTSISHSYNLDQSDGTLTLDTIINFNRGSYGGIIANLPSYKGPTIDIQKYIADLGLPQDDAISAQVAATKTRTTLPTLRDVTRHDTPTEAAIRQYVTLRINKGDMTPAEGQAIIASGQVPLDDYSLYQSLVQTYGGNTGHDTDGTN